MLQTRDVPFALTKPSSERSTNNQNAREHHPQSNEAVCMIYTRRPATEFLARVEDRSSAWRTES